MNPKEELIKLFSLELIKSIEVTTKVYSFEHSIRVYLNKPQVVNNWLAGSVIVEENACLENDLDSIKPGLKHLVKHFTQVQIRDFLSKSAKIFADIRYLTMLNAHLVLIYPLSVKCASKKFPSPSFVHLFEYDCGSEKKRLNLYAPTNTGDDECYVRQLRWLSNELLTKLNNWSQVISPDPDFKCAQLNTLKLYDSMINDYWKLYQTIKELYWDRFSPTWTEMTNTDPEKFIYEDIHIACYLILAWRHLNVKVNCFVDLGCGNGLLVYILNDQGYHGYGVDMRKRKIWSNQYYNDLNIKLIESTIIPTEQVFENCDWLIGNHSDELSPWLPVMAYKSKCNYFLIPCCMFDFYSKFDTKQGNKTRSNSYLDYLEKISMEFGFETVRDKLRIPSTKNVCFLGLNRNKHVVDADDDDSVKDRIEALMGKSNPSSSTLEFKPRELATCRPKHIPTELKELAIRTVVENLVSNNNSDSSSNNVLRKHDGTDWNCGRSMSMNEVAALFDRDTLKAFSLVECGGIKTLLRNHGRLFDVYDKKNVRLRILNHDMFNQLNEEKKKLLKTKRCPFDQYHPNGCLLKNEDCYFSHAENC